MENRRKKSILIVFGTRPEAIKMCPLVMELKKRESFHVKVCVSGQHKEMLQQVLDIFHVEPDYNLAVMKDGQTLADITTKVILGMNEVYDDCHPDILLVHGDTTTAYAAALAAFYRNIPIGHVEAGLRTRRMDSPFPEEFNRQSIDMISTYYFAPTETARSNLLKEGKPDEYIFVTGNTGIDALFITIENLQHKIFRKEESKEKLIVLTAHRRENLGEPMHHIFRAIRRIIQEFPEVTVVYPIHMNPKVRSIAQEELGDCDRMKIIEPLEVKAFHNLMNQSYFIMTDSGGIQEEAPALGKPVLVLRDTTERPEGVLAGTLKMVGTKENDVYEACKTLLLDRKEYCAMSEAKNPYGDGTASRQIADILDS